MSATHYVKCWPAYYDATARGDKPFEVRKDDRAYQADDTLCLQKYDPHGDGYLAEQQERKITFVLRGGQFGIEPGYVVLGLAPIQPPEGE